MGRLHPVAVLRHYFAILLLLRLFRQFFAGRLHHELLRAHAAEVTIVVANNNYCAINSSKNSLTNTTNPFMRSTLSATICICAAACALAFITGCQSSGPTPAHPIPAPAEQTSAPAVTPATA